MAGRNFDIGFIPKEIYDQRMEDAIKQEEIINIKKQVKVGDTISVKTNKSCSVDEGMNNRSGIWRKGTIIAIYQHFVHVRLENGVCESVLWVDIVGNGEENGDEED